MKLCVGLAQLGLNLGEELMRREGVDPQALEERERPLLQALGSGTGDTKVRSLMCHMVVNKSTWGEPHRQNMC